jgi:hypothetical protein
VQPRIATALAVGLAAAAVALMLVFGGQESSKAEPKEPAPGEPVVEIISPRNGARQNAHGVVVKVQVSNFRLAGNQFGGDPQLGEGHLRFSLNRVPNCVYPKKLEDAINSPLGKERLVGASFDFPRYAGPNGVLAERIGSDGSYSPATRPDLLSRAAARLLPAGRQPRPEQRRDDAAAVPRRHHLPDPAETGPPHETVPAGQGVERQRR